MGNSLPRTTRPHLQAQLRENHLTLTSLSQFAPDHTSYSQIIVLGTCCLSSSESEIQRLYKVRWDHTTAIPRLENILSEKSISPMGSVIVDPLSAEYIVHADPPLFATSWLSAYSRLTISDNQRIRYLEFSRIRWSITVKLILSICLIVRSMHSKST